MADRTRTQKKTVNGSTLTLADLRWLVNETEHWDENSRVVVRYEPGDRPFDASYYTVEVTGDEKA